VSPAMEKKLCDSLFDAVTLLGAVGSARRSPSYCCPAGSR
jgi:hypothetical protein